MLLNDFECRQPAWSHGSERKYAEKHVNRKRVACI